MHSYLLAYSNPISEHNGPGNSFPIWVSPVFKTFVRNIVKPFHHSLHTKLRWLSARVWRPIAFLLFSLLFFSLQLFICYLNQNTVNSCVCVLCLSIYGTLFLWRIVWVILSGISMFCNVNFLVFFLIIFSCTVHFKYHLGHLEHIWKCFPTFGIYFLACSDTFLRVSKLHASFGK